MTILNTFLFVLIAGIFSSTVAERRSVKTRIPTTSMALGFVNTTYEEIENFDISLCEKNGGPKAHDTQKKAFRRFQGCVTTAYMSAIFESEADGVVPASRRRGLAINKIHCRRLSSYENCVKNLTETVKLCLDPEKHVSANIMYNGFSKVMRFMCDNDGATIDRLNSITNTTCISSKRQAITACANQTIVEHVQATIPDGAAVGGLGSLHLLVPDVEKCNVLEKFQYCVVQELKECSDGIVSDIANSVFGILKEVATCDRLRKSNDASSSSVINTLLITGLTVISLLRSRYNI